MAYLDNNGVLYFWQKIKSYVSLAVSGLYTKPSGGIPASDLASGVIPTVPTATSDLTNDSNFVSDASYVHTDNNYTTTEKQKLAAFSSASDYALKTDLTGLYKYKGSVATVANLPSSGNTTGDVYNVESSGMNYAWDGSAWDALGEIFTVTAITNAEIDTICT